MNNQLASDEGKTIVGETEPDVASNPRLANCIWIQTGNPPLIKVWNRSTHAWVVPSTNGATAITGQDKLANPVFDPVSNTRADGFTITHANPSAEIWYSLNGADWLQFTAG